MNILCITGGDSAAISVEAMNQINSHIAVLAGCEAEQVTGEHIKRCKDNGLLLHLEASVIEGADSKKAVVANFLNSVDTLISERTKEVRRKSEALLVIESTETVFAEIPRFQKLELLKNLEILRRYGKEFNIKTICSFEVDMDGAILNADVDQDTVMETVFNQLTGFVEA